MAHLMRRIHRKKNTKFGRHAQHPQQIENISTSFFFRFAISSCKTQKQAVHFFILGTKQRKNAKYPGLGCFYQFAERVEEK